VHFEGFRMTSRTSVILSPSALSGPQGLAPRRGRISVPAAQWLASIKLAHYQPIVSVVPVAGELSALPRGAKGDPPQFEGRLGRGSPRFDPELRTMPWRPVAPTRPSPDARSPRGSRRFE